MQTMVICVAVSAGGGGVRYIAVSLPLIACLLDGKKYMLPVDPKPPQDESAPPPETSRCGAQRRKFEFRSSKPPRAPSLRSLVRLAQACDSAEELGKKLRRRYDQSLRRQGIDPNRGRQARAERELERRRDY